MRAHRVPGMALAITRGDRVVYLRGYGTAGRGRETTPRTRFPLASLSKSFTALAVLQLAERGLVDLDAPVRRYLPSFTLADPAAAARVTVRHLLGHTSGLSDAGFRDPRRGFPTTLSGRVSGLAVARPVGEPGAAFRYFNQNYEVLARLDRKSTR